MFRRAHKIRIARTILTVGNLEYGQPFNVGSQRAIMVSDLIDLIVELTSRLKPVVQDSKRMRPPNSDVRALLADCTGSTRATGWSSRIKLR